MSTLKLCDWNAICDRCGFEYKASELKEEWTGNLVCKHCWEPRHPQEFIRGTPDKSSVSPTRVEQPDSGGTDLNGNTFPPTYTYTPDVPPEGDNNGDL